MDKRSKHDTDLGPETHTSTDQTRHPNLSTEHQKRGDARLPSDTLDRDQPPPAGDGGKKSSLTRNA